MSTGTGEAAGLLAALDQLGSKKWSHLLQGEVLQLRRGWDVARAIFWGFLGFGMMPVIGGGAAYLLLSPGRGAATGGALGALLFTVLTGWLLWRYCGPVRVVIDRQAGTVVRYPRDAYALGLASVGTVVYEQPNIGDASLTFDGLHPVMEIETLSVIANNRKASLLFPVGEALAAWLGKALVEKAQPVMVDGGGGVVVVADDDCGGYDDGGDD